jgi:hypothetical protein
MIKAPGSNASGTGSSVPDRGGRKDADRADDLPCPPSTIHAALDGATVAGQHRAPLMASNRGREASTPPVGTTGRREAGDRKSHAVNALVIDDGADVDRLQWATSL